MTGDIITALAALLFVLALLGLLSWAVRRFGLLPGHVQTKSSERQIDIVETRMVDAKSRLLVARWRDTDYFMGVSQSGIELIDKRPVGADKQGMPMSNDNEDT